MQKVYLETTFIGYLTSRPSSDPLVAAHQQITREWWNARRSGFDLYASKLVVDEAGAGNEEAAQQRLAIVRELPLLDLSNEAVELSKDLVADGPFPEVAQDDALHVAVATVHGMDFLLTWNCRHIANAQVVRAAAVICNAKGYGFPSICTPELLMGE